VRIAITGAAGFVGTNLALAAGARGHEIVLYDARDRLGRLAAAGLADTAECRFGDLAAPGAGLGPDADVIVHLAALPHVDHSIHAPEFVVRNNLASMAAVLSSARRHGVPVLFTSSIEVYGGNDGAPFREDDPLTSLSPYAASKIGCEALVDAYRAAYGVRVTIARLTNLYGPWQAPDRVIPRVVTQMLLDRTSQAVRGRLRDFMHVDDAVTALFALLEQDGGVFNVATGNAVSVEEAAGRAAGRLDVVDAPAGDGRGRSLVACPDRLAVTTGWKPLVPLAEGIERTVAWYRDRQDWWAPFTALIRADRDGPGFLLDRAFPL
jgi:dTDP-glucose 4,6-dehydratase